MRTMKNQIFSRVGKKIASVIGETSIKISEKSIGKCGVLGIYEIKFPIEMLLHSKNEKNL